MSIHLGRRWRFRSVLPCAHPSPSNVSHWQSPDRSESQPNVSTGLRGVNLQRHRGRKEKRNNPEVEQRALDTAGHILLHTLLPNTDHMPEHRPSRMDGTFHTLHSCVLFPRNKYSSPTAALGWPNTVPEKNLFFQFSEEIKKFPSSSRRL